MIVAWTAYFKPRPQHASQTQFWTLSISFRAHPRSRLRFLPASDIASYVDGNRQAMEEAVREYFKVRHSEMRHDFAVYNKNTGDQTGICLFATE
jgi:hypothetical protein